MVWLQKKEPVLSGWHPFNRLMETLAGGSIYMKTVYERRLMPVLEHFGLLPCIHRLAIALITKRLLYQVSTDAIVSFCLPLSPTASLART